MLPDLKKKFESDTKHFEDNSSDSNNMQSAVTNMTKQRVLWKTLIQYALFCHVCNRSLCIIYVQAEMAEE